jgi:hypothetical protein
MGKKLILTFFLATGFYYSYSQLIQYKDLIGFTYSIKNSSHHNHIILLEFKDSFNVIESFDGKTSNLTYKLDGQYGITLVAMKQTNPILFAPRTSNGGGGAGRFFLVKKADGLNLKLQGFSSDKPTGWDDIETDENTFLMVPVNTI